MITVFKFYKYSIYNSVFCTCKVYILFITGIIVFNKNPNIKFNMETAYIHEVVNATLERVENYNIA